MENTKRRRLTRAERQQVYNKCHGHCAYCGTEITLKDMQADHVVPLHTGGKDTLDNLLPACRSCNHYKTTLTLEKFRKHLAGIPARLERDSVAYQVGKRFGIVQEWNADVEFYFERTSCTNRECPFHTDGPCAAAEGCAGYTEMETEEK